MKEGAGVMSGETPTGRNRRPGSTSLAQWGMSRDKGHGALRLGDISWAVAAAGNC